MPGVVSFVQMRRLSDDGGDYDGDDKVLMMVAAGHWLSV